MEIETGFIGENNVYQYPSVLFDNNHMKLPFNKNEFPIENSPPKSNHFQDFHNLDHHQFHANDVSSQNPIFSSQTQSNIDAFEPYAQSSYYKPFDQIVTNNNFQNSTGQYMNIFPSRNPILDVINGADWNRQEIIKPNENNFAAPDHEVSSCITAENGYYKRVEVMNKNPRTSLTKKRTYKSQKIKPNPVKGQWTGDEDRLLIQLVDQYGLRKWSHIAQMLPGRIGKQCRERWHNHLRPDIKKDTWSEEEDKVLIESHVEIGNKWAEIAKRLPGRTENSIKNHWNATKRRQHSKRKCRSKCPKPSLLQDYIKSLNLGSSITRTRQYQRKETPSNAIVNKSTVDHHHNNNQLQALDNMVCPIYPLVLEYDDHGFDDDPDFCFGKDMIFQEGISSIDSLFDDMENCVSLGAQQEEQVLIMDLQAEDNYIGAVMLESDQVVNMKKEMDLIEMISQGNK